MAKKTYAVHRAMHGDGKDYARGDTREMDEAAAADLVTSGALSLEGEVPAERTSAVEHTYGARESEVNKAGYTSATGEGIHLKRDVRPAAAKAPPARTR